MKKSKELFGIDLELHELLGDKEISFGCYMRTTKSHSHKNKGRIVQFAFIPEGRQGNPKEAIARLRSGGYFGDIKCVNDDGVIEQLEAARWGDTSIGEEWKRYNDNLHIVGHTPTIEDFYGTLTDNRDVKSFVCTGKSFDIEVFTTSGDVVIIQTEYDRLKPLIGQTEKTKMRIRDIALATGFDNEGNPLYS